ncbi:MAG: cytochrome c [Oligoflexales bacterium]
MLFCRSLLMFLSVFTTTFALGSEALYNYDSLIYRYNCVSCHGKDGHFPTVPGYPRIGGLSQGYLKQQLQDFRSGKRVNSRGKTMHDLARAFSDDVIEALSTEISAYTLPAVKSVPEHPGKKLYAEKGCIACHGMDGSQPIASFYPAIAGQHRDYLYTQSTDIKYKRRTGGQAVAMAAIIAAVPDEDLKVISEWLESVR